MKSTRPAKKIHFMHRLRQVHRKKALFPMLADRRNKHMDDGTEMPLRLSFIDMKKAYFNGVPSRLMYMSLPPELGLPKHFVAKQTRCVYGTRDAGMV